MNTKKNKSTLQKKTRIYIVLFSIGILLTIWISQVLFLGYAYESYQLNKIEKIVNKIENQDITILELETLAYDNEICIEIISDVGKGYIYNDKMLGCELNNPLVQKEIRKFINNSDTEEKIRIVNNKYDIKAVLYEIKNNYGSVILYSSLKDVSGASTILKNQLIYITILVTIVAVIIANYLSKKITEPIEKITKKAAKLKDGNFDERFDSSDIVEIDELSSTLNLVKDDLKKTNELRRDLMANVSHDLKTPLTMIKAYAEMIKDISYKDKKKLESNVDVIISETDRLNSLVNDILELSKMQSNAVAVKLNIVNYDLKEEIKKIIKNYEIMEKTKNYKFDVILPDKIMIKADKDRLNQVILNLLNNAINYTGDDNQVTLKVTESKKDYLVEVIDTGKGIKEEDIPYIWDKYYKKEVNKNHQREYIGSGIGLSIVKEILEKHGFKYGVNSQKNEGTTFYFKINK